MTETKLTGIKVAHLNDWERALALAGVTVKEGERAEGLRRFEGMPVEVSGLLPRGMAARIYDDGTAVPFHLFDNGRDID